MWRDARTLHVGDVWPWTSRWLLFRALADRPVRLCQAPEHRVGDWACANGESGGWGRVPDVSFLIGHRGEDRRQLLKTTLMSIASQTGVVFECIVVAQDATPRMQEGLPSWVRYIHAPAEEAVPFSRSGAFNTAAREAQGRILICHDGDLVVPMSYGESVARRLKGPVEVVQPKRFIFYLDQSTTDLMCRGGVLPDRPKVESVMENALGGGSVAIARDAYFAIGGFDEEFRGWGGEDNEFWDRCGCLKADPYGYLPMIHLWHRAQLDKSARNSAGIVLLASKREMTALERIARLRRRNFGVAGA